MLVLTSADFFSESTFSKYSFRNTTRVSSSLDSDQDRHSVGPDLGPNCLQPLARCLCLTLDFQSLVLFPYQIKYGVIV